MRIVIVNIGLGNVGSVKNILKKAGFDALISANLSEVQEADKLILPGVGRFDEAVLRMNDLGLDEVLKQKAHDGTPLLGICLGMQLLLNGSEEGDKEGLGLINGYAKKFVSGSTGNKIPHMGWNNALFNDHDAWKTGLADSPKFYFVHSYYAALTHIENELCSTDYILNFSSGIIDGKVCGVQFHPEKSHRYGLQLLKNFVNT